MFITSYIILQTRRDEWQAQALTDHAWHDDIVVDGGTQREAMHVRRSRAWLCSTSLGKCSAPAQNRVLLHTQQAPMLPTHLHAEVRYEELRRLALETAQQGASPGIRFSVITAEALRAARIWVQAPDRKVGWDWAAGYSVFRFRHPKRFELAAWEQGTLMALSLGRPTYNGNHLRLDFVEAQPRSLGPRPALFDDVLVAYNVYGRLLNAKQIRIMHPVNAEVRSHYEKYGYVYVAGHDYLSKELV